MASYAINTAIFGNTSVPSMLNGITTANLVSASPQDLANEICQNKYKSSVYKGDIASTNFNWVTDWTHVLTDVLHAMGYDFTCSSIAPQAQSVYRISKDLSNTTRALCGIMSFLKKYSITADDRVSALLTYYYNQLISSVTSQGYTFDEVACVLTQTPQAKQPPELEDLSPVIVPALRDPFFPLITLVNPSFPSRSFTVTHPNGFEQQIILRSK